VQIADGVAGRVVAPQRLDQVADGHHASLGQGETGQHHPLRRPAERDRPPVESQLDRPQQPQLDVHAPFSTPRVVRGQPLSGRQTPY
jgi:hypothetical protein